MSDSNSPAPEAKLTAMEWEEKLKGQDVVNDESVRMAHRHIRDTADDRTQIKAQLPEGRRILAPGVGYTRDYNPYRLNIHVDENGVCTHCGFF